MASSHVGGGPVSTRLHLWERSEDYAGGPVFELANIEYTGKTTGGTKAHIEFGDARMAF